MLTPETASLKFSYAQKYIAWNDYSIVLSGIGENALSVILRHKSHPKGLFDKCTKEDEYNKSSVQSRLIKLRLKINDLED